MRSYRGPEGDERIWYEAAEIEQIMEDELHRAGLWPSLHAEAVDVEAFIENHLRASLDQYADLEPSVLGLTEFRQGPPRVRINRELTGSAMDDEWCPPGVQGRWRATLAHEAAHIVLHRILFELNPAQTALFAEVPSSGSLLRCLKRDVAYRSTGRDWREVQANRGMAALLMPKTIFLAAANEELKGDVQTAARRLARRFQVSREAAAIRLATFGFTEAESGSQLFA